MRLILDTSRVKFTVSKEPEPKRDNQTGAQKHDRQTNAPLVVTELVAREQGNGAEVIKVTTAGEPPKVTEDQPVVCSGLQALPWAQNGRNGVAFRAESIEPVTVGKSTASAAASGAKLVNTETAAMTQNQQQAEQQAWSQYLEALHATEAAWTARCIAWGDAVRNQLEGDALRRYSTANREWQLCHDREQAARRQWQRIAYPLYDVPQPDEDVPGDGSAST
jgi:hypothetical protein